MDIGGSVASVAGAGRGSGRDHELIDPSIRHLWHALTDPAPTVAES